MDLTTINDELLNLAKQAYETREVEFKGIKLKFDKIRTSQLVKTFNWLAMNCFNLKEEAEILKVFSSDEFENHLYKILLYVSYNNKKITNNEDIEDLLDLINSNIYEFFIFMMFFISYPFLQKKNGK